MMKIPKSFKLLFIISILFSIFAVTSLAISAEAYEVTSLFDYSGTPENGDEGTLRYALEETNDDVITFSSLLFEQPNRTIYLNEQLVISRDLKIEGPGPNKLTIRGDSCRIFNIQGNATSVDISGLSLVNGYANDYTDDFGDGGGGAIYSNLSNLENLNIDNCRFSNNSGENGGAIYHHLASKTNTTISDSVFENNSSTESGGAIRNYSGDLTIINCLFSKNESTSGGGAIDFPGYARVDGNMTIIDSTFTGNISSVQGGAVQTSSDDTNTIENCVFYENATEDEGGGLWVANAELLDINQCIFDNNSSDTGGAICAGGGNINLRNSTISGNTATFGGGIAADNTQTLNILNCTIVSNDATTKGGGLYNNHSLSNVNIFNCTINGNSSPQVSAIDNSSGTVNLKNTLVAGNTSSDGTQIFDVPEENISFSIISDDISTLVSGDLAVNGAPSVGSTLSGDQYPLRTLALKENSPAVDSGDNISDVLSRDQRGFPRPWPEGGSFDIGAYELIYDYDTFTVTTEASPGGYIDPVSADVVEGFDKDFTVKAYPGYVLAGLTRDEEIIDLEEVDENGKYTLENVTEPHNLNATFEIDPEMLQEAQTGSFDITGTTGTTNHPPAADDPVGITEEEIISLSIEPVSSNDVGTGLSETDFAAGVSFEIGFESPDVGKTGVVQVDLELMITSKDLGTDTFDAISQAENLETAFFENVSLYKVLGGQSYDLFNLAADYIGMDDVYEFFIVTETEDAYKVAMTVVIADMAAPDDTEPVLALSDGQELLFFVYDGNQDGKFSDPVVALRKSAVDPVDPDEPTLEGGSCNVGAFTPLAGLLVLPLLLMFKK